MARGPGHALALVSCVYGAGVVGVALLFHRTLPHQMYMDEIFHIVQTQKYCDNRWAEW